MMAIWMRILELRKRQCRAPYTIALAGQPAGAVTVTPTSSNSDVDCTEFTPPLSFDGTNWNTTQTVGSQSPPRPRRD